MRITIHVFGKRMSGWHRSNALTYSYLQLFMSDLRLHYGRIIYFEFAMTAALLLSLGVVVVDARFCRGR